MNAVYSMENSTAHSAGTVEYSRSAVAESNFELPVASGRVQHSVRRLESRSHTGLQIGDRIMLYSKDGKRHSESFTVDPGCFETGVKVLVMDVKAGTWEVSGGDGPERLSVSNDGGYLFFKAESGICQLEFIEG